MGIRTGILWVLSSAVSTKKLSRKVGGHFQSERLYAFAAPLATIAYGAWSLLRLRKPRQRVHLVRDVTDIKIHKVHGKKAVRNKRRYTSHLGWRGFLSSVPMARATDEIRSFNLEATRSPVVLPKRRVPRRPKNRAGRAFHIRVLSAPVSTR